MYTKATPCVCSVSLALSLATALAPGAAQAVSSTWINGNGNYSDITKWDVPVAPCNAGSTEFQVRIPDNSGTISVDLTCGVDTLYLGDNNTLRILPGNSHSVHGQAALYGFVHGAGGDFTASSALFGSGARAYAESGSVITIGAPNYSSTGWIGDIWVGSNTLFSSMNEGSKLNLSLMLSMNSGFDDGKYAEYKITASDAGEIDLSGLRSVTSPFSGEDRLMFEVTDTAIIDLSSLATVSGGGLVDFALGDAVLRIGVMDNVIGGVQARFLMNNSSSQLVAPTSFKPDTAVTIIAVAHSNLRIGKDYAFSHTDETRIDLESAVVRFDGKGSQFAEVGGFDIGTLTPTGPNFGFGQMVVGSDTQATTVYLRDAIDNGNGHVLCGPGKEALYLLGLPADPMNPTKSGNGLRILGGATLVLNGIPLYTMQDGALVDVRTWFPPGQTVIAYALNNSNGFIALGSSPDTDADNDGVIDMNDNCVFVANADQCDTNNDGYGNICDPDLNNDGIVNAEDLAQHFKPFIFKENDDADLDCNGIVQSADLAIMKKMFFLSPGPSCVAP